MLLLVGRPRCPSPSPPWPTAWNAPGDISWLLVLRVKVLAMSWDKPEYAELVGGRPWCAGVVGGHGRAGGVTWGQEPMALLWMLPAKMT